jgi:hypothetical protein
MDKNMIHIDDLIRQRLNGEEQERAGAWLRMKDLLDKDMPVRPAIGMGWRKTLLLSAAIVAAIATVGITGYQMSSSFRGTADNSATTVANPSFATKKATENTAYQTTQPAEADNAIAATNGSDKALNPTTPTNVDVRVRPADKTKNTNPNTNKANTNKATNNSIANNTSNTVNQPQQTTSSVNTNNANTPSSSYSVASNNKPQLPNQQRSVTNNTAQNDSETLPKFETVSTTSYTSRWVVNPRTNTATEVVELTGRGELQREIPAPTATTAPGGTAQEMVIAKQETMIAAKAPYGPPRDEYYSSAENSFFAKKNSGSSSNKGGASVWQNVSQFFKNAQYQLGNTKINTGVIGGLNKTFGNYGLLGMNVGMFSDFMFSEQWGARVEAKYMHWFNQGTTYRNDYDSYVQEGNLYTKYKNDHSFKYSTMWNADVPVMLQYRPYKSNVAIFAGANLSYFSKLTPEETNHQTLVTTGLTSAPAPAVPMTVADFNSRFGMGAILGVGYNVSEMMQVGFRVSQSLTDNAKGTNAHQVSKDLYRTPNFQLNFSYRFGKDKKEN